jgi:hypothetical protein
MPKSDKPHSDKRRGAQGSPIFNQAAERSELMMWRAVCRLADLRGTDFSEEKKRISEDGPVPQIRGTKIGLKVRGIDATDFKLIFAKKCH